MTYCLATMVDQGLVFASDSRTNAGVDQLSTYSKMFTFGIDGERVFVVLSAGNLATTQAVVNQIKRDIKQAAPINLNTVADMNEAADYLGQISIAQQQKTHSTSAGTNLDASASFILGGQVLGGRPEIFMIYPEGNFIAATREHPYQQIGEVKYGKPILDRIITGETSLEQAATCAMVSMDSTMRSNATVGPPIEVLIYVNDSLQLNRRFAFKADDPYLIELKQAWDAKLKESFSELHIYGWDVNTGAV
ncbi:MAG: peptidase [Chromatiales bacterium]